MIVLHGYSAGNTRQAHHMPYVYFCIYVEMRIFSYFQRP